MKKKTFFMFICFLSLFTKCVQCQPACFVSNELTELQPLKHAIRLNTGWHHMEETIFVTENGGALQSPEFPKKYPRSVFLSWQLLSPPGTHILLKFDHHFRLEDSAENGGCW